MTAWRERVLHLAVLGLLCAGLQISYVRIQAEIFAYAGVVVRPMGGFLHAWGWILALAPGLWMPLRLQRFSDAVLFYLYLIIYIPFQLVGFHYLNGDLGGYLPASLGFLGVFLVTVLAARLGTRPLPGPALSFPAWRRLLSGLMLVFVLIILRTRTLSLSVFDLSTVYEQRILARAEAGGNLLSAYAFPLMLHGVCPLALAAGLALRRWSLAILAVACVIVSFLAAGAKSSLAEIVLVGFGVYLGGRARPRPSVVFPLLLGAILGLGSLAYFWIPDIWLHCIFTNRIFYDPVLCSTTFMAYIKSHPPFLFSDIGGLSGFLYQLGLGPLADLGKGQTVGYWSSGNLDSNLNVNPWVSGWLDLGPAGLALVAAAVILLLRLLDGITAGKSARVVVPMGFFFGFLLAENSLNALVTNGALILWAPLLWLAPDLRQEIP